MDLTRAAIHNDTAFVVTTRKSPQKLYAEKKKMPTSINQHEKTTPTLHTTTTDEDTSLTMGSSASTRSAELIAEYRKSLQRTQTAPARQQHPDSDTVPFHHDVEPSIRAASSDNDNSTITTTLAQALASPRISAPPTARSGYEADAEDLIGHNSRAPRHRRSRGHRPKSVREEIKIDVVPHVKTVLQHIAVHACQLIGERPPMRRRSSSNFDVLESDSAARSSTMAR